MTSIANYAQSLTIRHSLMSFMVMASTVQLSKRNDVINVVNSRLYGKLWTNMELPPDYITSTDDTAYYQPTFEVPLVEIKTTECKIVSGNEGL